MLLYELIYVSVATRKLSPIELTELLNQSQQKNLRMNVTGLLVYHNSEFMQLLEGSKTDINAIYDTICKDERNHHNLLLWSYQISERSFPDWSMAFLTPENLSLVGKPAYSDFLNSGLIPQTPSSSLAVGKRFLLALRDDFLKREN